MGDLIKRVTTSNDVMYIELVACFSSAYRYYEVVLDNVTPCVYDAHLRAQYGQEKGWLTESLYNTETWSNDRGGSNATSDMDTSFLVYPNSRQGPTDGGVYGTMTIFNPQNASNVPFTALLYAPIAHRSWGCQVFSGGSYLLQGSAAQLTSIRFFYDQKDAHNNSIYAGSTVSIYGTA
ncbi:hypothetical protein [Solidesulfovibrio alcoholivorans]|uniref:hypothetical protein n=1 Tax=Solidesulfovibrio alcoholivorans TaxID=81406 RepID=UPI000495FB35|nr:hypothetical protein [Solidesulfovibrio alcoholivorans]